MAARRTAHLRGLRPAAVHVNDEEAGGAQLHRDAAVQLQPAAQRLQRRPCARDKTSVRVSLHRLRLALKSVGSRSESTSLGHLILCAARCAMGCSFAAACKWAVTLQQIEVHAREAYKAVLAKTRSEHIDCKQCR